MDVAIYIKETRLDLFKDEKISINLSIKNLSDIGKVLSDFTQSFSVPASPTNNEIFTHWYDATVDGTFNANIRIDAYIELKSLPFRFGCIQLDSAKLKNGLPSSYSITFYSKAVNLTDLFKDDQLSSLEFSEYDHEYNDDIVFEAMRSPSIGNGDIYYPLITSTDEISIGTGGGRDLLNPSNEISWREFKPALRIIRIVEAIELKYGVVFSRDFFDRSVFYNIFMWLHRDAEQLKAFGNPVYVDLTNSGNLASVGVSIDTVNDTISYVPKGSGLNKRYLYVFIVPSVGFENVGYKIDIELDGEVVASKEGSGGLALLYESESTTSITIKAKVTSSASFDFTSKIYVRLRTNLGNTAGEESNPEQSITSSVVVSQQMPEMTVRDFINSCIALSNLIIKPNGSTDFTVDTLDSFYDKGVAFDITKYVDIKEMTVKRPDVKKQIEFAYQKSGAILGAKYFENNGIGYGDLKANFETDGTDLKIQPQLENMLFERLQDESTEELTDYQVGFSINAELKPYKGKPYFFYRNSFSDGPEITIQPAHQTTRIYHTATEDNIEFGQVTNSLNYGSDISSYFYSPIEKGLYFNFWKTFISDLYNRKTRIYNIKAVLPVSVLYAISLNDIFIISDKKYKISIIKADLTTGQCDLEIFTDFSSPIDSAANVIPLTVDNTFITVDSEQYTVDQVSVHEPVTSYIQNGISLDNYASTASAENFEIKVTANTVWTVSKVDTGDGTGWFNSNKVNGFRSDYVRASTNYNSGSVRSGVLRVTIGADNFDILITQNV